MIINQEHGIPMLCYAMQIDLAPVCLSLNINQATCDISKKKTNQKHCPPLNESRNYREKKMKKKKVWDVFLFFFSFLFLCSVMDESGKNAQIFQFCGKTGWTILTAKTNTHNFYTTCLPFAFLYSPFFLYFYLLLIKCLFK